MVRLAKHRECRIYETGPTYLIFFSSLIFYLLISSQTTVATRHSFLPSQASLSLSLSRRRKEGKKYRKAGRKGRFVQTQTLAAVFFILSLPTISPQQVSLAIIINILPQLLLLFHVLVAISVPFSSFLIHGRRSASSPCCGWDKKNDPRLLVQPFLPFLLQMARFFTLLLLQILFRSNPSDLLFLSMLNSLVVVQVCIILPL